MCFIVSFWTSAYIFLVVCGCTSWGWLVIQNHYSYPFSTVLLRVLALNVYIVLVVVFKIRTVPISAQYCTF